MAKYFIERIQITGSSPVTIGGINSAAFAPNIQRLVSSGSNLLDPTQHTITEVTPEITFATFDVKTVLDLLFANTTPHTAIGPAAHATLILWLQSVDAATRGGTASTDNIKLTVNKGMLTPVRMTNQNGMASIECRVDCIYDGTNPPVVRSAADQNLPSAIAPAAALWRLHGIEDDDNSTPDQVQNIATDWAINFGISVFRHVPSTSIYPTQAGIEAFAPTAEFGSTAVASELTASGMLGKVVDQAGMNFYLAAHVAGTGNFSTSGGLALTFVGSTAGGKSYYHPTTLNLDGGLITVRYAVVGIGGVATGVTPEPPLTYATTQTMPTGTTTDEAFRVGTAGDATTAAFVVTGGDVDFGISVEPLTPSTKIWPDTASVRERTPVITLRTRDAEDALNAAIGEGRAIATAFDLFLRHVDTESAPLVDASTVHTRLQVLTGVIEPVDLGGDHGSEAETGVRVVAVEDGDGDGDIMTITTGIAIT